MKKIGKARLGKAKILWEVLVKTWTNKKNQSFLKNGSLRTKRRKRSLNTARAVKENKKNKAHELRQTSLRKPPWVLVQTVFAHSLNKTTSYKKAFSLRDESDLHRGGLQRIIVALPLFPDNCVGISGNCGSFVDTVQVGLMACRIPPGASVLDSAVTTVGVLV